MSRIEQIRLSNITEALKSTDIFAVYRNKTWIPVKGLRFDDLIFGDPTILDTNLNVTGYLEISGTDPATSTSTGALQVDGGISVDAASWFGDDILLEGGDITIDHGGLVNAVINLHGSTNYQIRATATDLLQLRDSTSGVVRLEISSSKVTTKQALQVDGDCGFYGTTPISQPTALTASAIDAVDGTYGTEEADVINNLRTRVDELETKLQALGLLA